MVAFQRGDVKSTDEWLAFIEQNHAAGGRQLESILLALAYAQKARVEGTRDYADLATTVAMTALESPNTPPPFMRASLLIALAEAAVARGGQEEIERLYQQLGANSTYNILGLAWGYQGEHWMGMLAAAMGELDTAIEHYENARAVGGTDFPLEYSWACYEIAHTLHRRGAPGDDDRASTELQQATDLATKYGMRPLLERCLALRLEMQGVSSTDSQSSIYTIAESVQSERPDFAPNAAPDGTVTLMFSDIVDSTPLNERLGDTAWMALLREHGAIVEREVAAHRGHVVKTMGDGFMVAFSSAREGLRCAIALQQDFAARNTAADEPIEARIGLHTGEVVHDRGDFFGKHVNLAARIGASASGGEILVSSLLAQLVEPSGEFRLEARAARAFKGLEGEHVTYVVGWN
jgi:class 3 adenylate cyclase